MDVFIFLYIQDQPDHCRRNLAQDRRVRGARNTQLRKTKQAEDHDRVEDQVDHSTRHLRNHTVKGSAGGLQKPFKRHLEKDAK